MALLWLASCCFSAFSCTQEPLKMSLKSLQAMFSCPKVLKERTTEDETLEPRAVSYAATEVSCTPTGFSFRIPDSLAYPDPVPPDSAATHHQQSGGSRRRRSIPRRAPAQQQQSGGSRYSRPRLRNQRRRRSVPQQSGSSRRSRPRQHSAAGSERDSSGPASFAS